MKSMAKVLYKIGNKEVYVYDEIINQLVIDYGNAITLDQVEYAVKQLRPYGIRYWSTIDNFALISYYMEEEKVQIATIIS